MRPYQAKSQILLWLLSAYVLLGTCSGCGGADQKDDHVLASGVGVTITGPSQAIPSDVLLGVSPLTMLEANAKASLPADCVFVAGANCDPVCTLLRPVRLNIAIPHKFLPGWRLEVYALQGNTWALTGREATVDDEGLTVRVDTRQLTCFIVCLDSHWKTLVSDDGTVVFREDGLVATSLGHPKVLATGTEKDASFVSKLCEVTGYSESQASAFLTSYDTTGSNVVKIVQLRSSTVVCRNWGPSGKLGRWFAPTMVNHLETPQEARARFALPEANTATGCTLYRLKSGAILVSGICADMSQNTPTFGSYATGGGFQFFAPNATQWVVDHAEINPAVLELLAEIRYPKP
jgi:hypothetical protein